jgi:hypothetical protein
MNKDQKKDTERKSTKPGKNQNTSGRPDQKDKKQNQQLNKEDLPDSTNESRGNVGSGQRQDSN